MSSKFLINATAIGNGVTPNLPDPFHVIWSDEGDRERTHSGDLSTVAFSMVRCLWPDIYRLQFDAMMDFYKTLSADGAKATSVKLLDEHLSDLDTWTTYSQYDSTGIWIEKPTGRADGHLIKEVEWIIRHIKPAEL